MRLIPRLRPAEITIGAFILTLIFLHAYFKSGAMWNIVGILIGWPKYLIRLIGLALLTVPVFLVFTEIFRIVGIKSKLSFSAKKFAINLPELLRSLILFCLIGVVYMIMGAGGDLVQRVNHMDYSYILKAIDHTFLGVSLPEFMDRFVSPQLNNIMAFGYSTHIIIPLMFLAILVILGRIRESQDYVFGLVLSIVIVFSFSFVIPSASPIYPERIRQNYIQGVYAKSTMESFVNLWTYGTAYAFISLHAAFMTLILFYSYRIDRILFQTFLPFILLNWASCIYFQLHHMMDIPLAVIVAYISDKVATEVNKRYINRPDNH